MPSPFPGMDPFLEDPGLFPNLHESLIVYLQEWIQPQLPEPYYAAIGKRIWIESSHRYVEPDVDLLRLRAHSPPAAGGGAGTVTATAPADTVRAKGVVVRVPLEEHQEAYLEIYARREGEDRLVTSIEMLSISNKTPGQRGRELYLRKQNEVLGRAHLVEIDLLRGGLHTTSVDLARAREEAGRFDYHVSVYRFDQPEEYVVYPIWLTDRLPEIDIPLLPGDAAIPVDIQPIFDRCYETAGCRRRIDYLGGIPAPPLPADQEEWVRHILETSAPSRTSESGA